MTLDLVSQMSFEADYILDHVAHTSVIYDTFSDAMKSQPPLDPTHPADAALLAEMEQGRSLMQRCPASVLLLLQHFGDQPGNVLEDLQFELGEDDIFYVYETQPETQDYIHSRLASKYIFHVAARIMSRYRAFRRFKPV